MQYEQELLEEIEEIIDVRRVLTERKRVPVIFDGNQYTIKIPKSLAEMVRMSAEDGFEFVVTSKVSDGKLRHRLEGRHETDNTS